MNGRFGWYYLRIFLRWHEISFKISLTLVAMKFQFRMKQLNNTETNINYEMVNFFYEMVNLFSNWLRQQRVWFRRRFNGTKRKFISNAIRLIQATSSVSIYQTRLLIVAILSLITKALSRFSFANLLFVNRIETRLYPKEHGRWTYSIPCRA